MVYNCALFILVCPGRLLSSSKANAGILAAFNSVDHIIWAMKEEEEEEQGPWDEHPGPDSAGHLGIFVS